MSRAMQPSAVEPSTWLNQRERGAVWGIQLVFFLARLFGRRIAGWVVRCVAAYYVLFDRTSRRASRGWLARVFRRPATLGEVYRHIACFAQVALDRAFFLQGDTRWFSVTRNGNTHLKALRDEKRGAILLGAHLGSFEAMRASSGEERFAVSIVGHFENAKMINSLLSRLDPETSSRVIHVGDDPMGFAVTVRERLQEGGLVAVLADRVGLNDRTVSVDFFGARARFPSGPFLLAAALKCPVYLVFGLFHEPNRYDLYCEPFAERIELPRKDRSAALESVVQRYASRLEGYCTMAPYNWFNFYDFWESEPA